MNSTSHIVIGASVGVATGNPWWALAGGIISHVVLDVIPHTDQGTFMKDDEEIHWPKWAIYTAFLDIALGGAIFLFILTLYNVVIWPSLFAGALGGMTIDLFDNVPYWKKSFRKTSFGQIFHRIHDKLHWTVQKQYWWFGALTQIIVLGGGLWYLWQNSLLS